VAEQAGRHLKKTVLELGGSDPFIVLDDADWTEPRAPRRGASDQQRSKLHRRETVHRGGAGGRPLPRAFTTEMRARKVGDPLDHTTQVGPQARLDLAQSPPAVQESVKRGPTGSRGELPPAGAFYPPACCRGGARMPAFDEETFGPWRP